MSVIVSRTPLCCVPASATNVCFPAIPIETTIPVATTVSVDSASTVHYRAVKWLVNLANVGETKIRTFEVYATHRNGALPTFNLYGIEGSMMTITVDVVIVGSALTLKITNGEASTLTAYILRIGVPIDPTFLPPEAGVEIASRNSFVDASTTSTIDIISFPDIRGAKWLVNVTDEDGGTASACQVFALMAAGLTAADVSYSFIGDISLNFELNTVAVGSDLELQITNNDVFEYHVNVTRLPITVVPFVPDCGAPFAKVSLWIPSPPTITPGSTVTVDNPSFNPTGTVAVKWLVGVFQPSTDKTLSFELEATQQSAGVCSFVEYGLLGDSLSIDVNVTIVGTNFIFDVKNNEASDIVVYATRLPVFS